MAGFAPQLPDMPIPDWTNNSRPVTQPESDKSKGIALTTAGTAIEGATDIAERADTDNIKQRVRAGVDAARDTTTLAYESIRKAQMTGQQPSPQAMQTAGFTGSLLGQVGNNVPPGLQSGLDQAGGYGTALAQGGISKANDTLYTGQLNALAKRLRAEYPGHIDLIDQTISQISGKNPANAYMDNLLQDINRNAMASNTAKNRLLSKAYSALGDMPDDGHSIWPYIKAYEAGLPGSEDALANRLDTGYRDKAQFDKWQRDRTVQQANRTDDAETAKDQFRAELGAAASRTFNGILDVPGLSSPQMIQKMVQDSQEGRITLTPEQHSQLLSAAVAARDKFYQQAKNIANTRGYSGAIHDPTTEKAIIANEAQNFDRLVESIQNKDYGTLFEAKRRMDAIQSGTKQALMDDRDMGPYWRLNDVIGGMPGGKVWLDRLDSVGVTKGYLGNLQSFINNANKVASAPDDLRNDGQAKSMYAHIQQLQQYQKAGNQVDPRAYHDVVHFVDSISDPKASPAIKAEIAKYAFNENNFKTLDAFKMDFTDSSGKFHQGKYSVFDTLTQPGVTDNIWNLKDRNTWSMYKNWAETSFSNLYREDLANMNSISMEKSIPMRVLWDSDNNRFHLDDGKGGPLRGTTNVEQNTINNANQVISRLNAGLYNLSQVQKKEGGDTSAYLLHSMMQMGFDPEHIQGFPADVYEAIKNSKAKRDLSTAFEKARSQ